MSEINRALIPFTNEHFAAFVQKMIGQPYWYGCCGYKATTGLLTRKSNQYPSHYGDSRTARYKQDIRNNAVVCDCIGGVKGYMWSDGGQVMLDAIGKDGSVANKYGANDCPDKGANSMFAYAKSKGADWGVISTLPELVGLALHKEGHIGYYIGNGYAVEWKGFSYGCVKTKVTGRGWTHWYRLPFIDYGEGVSQQPIVADVPLGSRQLTKGMEGNDVKALQEYLVQLGCALPKYGIDGDFGSETERAIIAFQKKQGLTADGKYGEETHKAVMAAIADSEDGKPNEPSAEESTPDEPPAAVGTQVKIISQSGKVNVRVGNGTEYSRITSVADGSLFPFVATAVNGWNGIVINGQVGWVSGKYSQIV